MKTETKQQLRDEIRELRGRTPLVLLKQDLADWKFPSIMEYIDELYDLVTYIGKEAAGVRGRKKRDKRKKK